nr:MAG TPA: PROTEIN/RNA Complex, archaeal, ribosomal, 50S, protein.0A [Caudoviricetes sp.]
MAKYIDQSVAIARLTHLEVTKPTATMTDAKRALADMFPADVVPVVHGRWVPFHSEAAGDIQYCSACEIGFGAKMDFCPNCGAKMDL